MRIVSAVEVERQLVVCRSASRLVRSPSRMAGAIAVTGPMAARCRPPVAERLSGSGIGESYSLECGPPMTWHQGAVAPLA